MSQNDNDTPNEDESSTTDLEPLDPGTCQHAAVTAVAAAVERHDRYVHAPEIIGAADELDILQTVNQTAILRRLPNLQHEGFLNWERKEADTIQFSYSVSNHGQVELDEHGYFGAEP